MRRIAYLRAWNFSYPYYFSLLRIIKKIERKKKKKLVSHVRQKRNEDKRSVRVRIWIFRGWLRLHSSSPIFFSFYILLYVALMMSTFKYTLSLSAFQDRTFFFLLFFPLPSFLKFCVWETWQRNKKETVYTQARKNDIKLLRKKKKKIGNAGLFFNITGRQSKKYFFPFVIFHLFHFGILCVRFH